MQSSEEWIRLAQILRPQGRKGEVLADLFTENPECFESDRKVWLAEDGFAERSASGTVATPPTSAAVIAYWLPVGRNAGRIVLHFEGVTSIDAAEKLAGKEVVIRASERVPLSDGSMYVSDMMGAKVFNGEALVGEIEEVLFPVTPDGTRRLDDAAPLLSVHGPEGDEILIPFAAAYVLELDLPGRKIRMQLPAGLLEINRGRPAVSDCEPEEPSES